MKFLFKISLLILTAGPVARADGIECLEVCDDHLSQCMEDNEGFICFQDDRRCRNDCALAQITFPQDCSCPAFCVSSDLMGCHLVSEGDTHHTICQAFLIKRAASECQRSTSPPHDSDDDDVHP